MVKTVKSIIKSIFCNGVYYTGLLHVYIKWRFLKRKEYPAVIINYHSFVQNLDNIIETHPSITHLIEDFKKEIRFLEQYFNIRSLDDIVDHLSANRKFTKPTIGLTIDDGYKDNYDLMFPVLKERNIPVTIFLSTAVIGTNLRNWYDRFANILQRTPAAELRMNGLFGCEKFRIRSMAQKRDVYNRVVKKLKNVDIEQRKNYLGQAEEQLGPPGEERPLMLNWNEVRDMARSNITFGAHTHTHPILTKMPIEEAKEDIMWSKQIIEEKLGGSVRHFAYPNGRKTDFNKTLTE